MCSLGLKGKFSTMESLTIVSLDLDLLQDCPSVLWRMRWHTRDCEMRRVGAHSTSKSYSLRSTLCSERCELDIQINSFLDRLLDMSPHCISTIRMVERRLPWQSPISWCSVFPEEQKRHKFFVVRPTTRDRQKPSGCEWRCATRAPLTLCLQSPIHKIIRKLRHNATRHKGRHHGV